MLSMYFFYMTFFTYTLIHSFLSNRKQFVSINGHNSEMRNCDCGVPQGSSLGPLLFLIYINDFRLCLDETVSGHFADDTFILYSGKKLKTIETIINTELNPSLGYVYARHGWDRGVVVPPGIQGTASDVNLIFAPVIHLHNRS